MNFMKSAFSAIVKWLLGDSLLAFFVKGLVFTGLLLKVLIILGDLLPNISSWVNWLVMLLCFLVPGLEKLANLDRGESGVKFLRHHPNKQGDYLDAAYRVKWDFLVITGVVLFVWIDFIKL